MKKHIKIYLDSLLDWKESITYDELESTLTAQLNSNLNKEQLASNSFISEAIEHNWQETYNYDDLESLLT